MHVLIYFKVQWWFPQPKHNYNQRAYKLHWKIEQKIMRSPLQKWLRIWQQFLDSHDYYRYCATNIKWFKIIYWWKCIFKISEFDLFCEHSKLGTIAKMLFFAGFGTGTFASGLISDTYGRKTAIVLMAQMLFGFGILTATMPNYVTFVIFWFFTGR